MLLIEKSEPVKFREQQVSFFFTLIEGSRRDMQVNQYFEDLDAD